MERKCDAIILLGFRLNDDGTAHPELRERCRAAAQCWREGIAPVIVACGGPTGKSGRTEAEVMREILVELGIRADCVIAEDQSMITSENVANARGMLGAGKKRLALVTSDYHIFRAALICRRAGFRVKRFPVATPGGRVKREKYKLEAMFTFNMLMGWENPGKKRPRWAERLARGVTMPMMERVKTEEEKP